MKNFRAKQFVSHMIAPRLLRSRHGRSVRWLIPAGVLLIMLCVLTACASTDETDLSTAHGASYRVDAMSLRTPMTVRPVQTHIFYFKNCTDLGEASYYSKTSYGCAHSF